MRLYSWHPERRATRSHIRYFIRQALERKKWAATMPEEWKIASQMSQDMLAEYRALSVKELARKSMEYARLRAFMMDGGRFINRPERTLWDTLADGESTDPDFVSGWRSGRDGVKWWDNPHPAGSAESYRWDQGHTRWRTHHGKAD